MEFREQELELIERAEWRVTQSLSLRGFCLTLLFGAISLHAVDMMTTDLLAGTSVGLVVFSCVFPQWAPYTPRYSELVDLLVRKRRESGRAATISESRRNRMILENDSKVQANELG